ncbi:MULTISPECIES: hypothetical protein [unclassified Cupriavidus]|uniref:hypothetical protein n=1 Tax=unclassified Cupriavidus TaxID=2640874 RepID=UPI0010F81619|nr:MULTISPECIES: hypothetical protein [unclassified Cupriavidus]MWL92047.1 hypothetical protein [Cupriavidus sp. SW-Y-13]
MPQGKDKKAQAEQQADIVNYAGSTDTARYALALRQAFGDIPVSEDMLSRLLECIRNVQRTTDKIKRLILDLGADLQQIHDSATEIAVTHYGDSRAARSRGWDLFFHIAENHLELSRSKAELYLNLYRRFLSHNGALSKLNVGELMILRRNDYTDDEIDAVIEYKETDPTYHRDNIRKFVDKLRRQQEDLSEVQNRLDIATGELASTVAENTEKDFEIRKLNSEISRLTAASDANSTALSAAREELTRQNATFSRLQMQIHDLEQEKQELQSRIAYSKAHARPETVPIEIVPPGYASLEEALTAKNEQLAAAQAELTALQSKRDAIDHEISENQDALDRRTRASESLRKLVQMFESLVSTFASAQLAVQLDGEVEKYRPTLSVLDGIVIRLQADIRAALKSA